MSYGEDRIRKHTAADVLRRIDDGVTQRLRQYAEADASRVEDRLGELDREWDTDRAIELEASMTGIAGLALAAFVDRRFLAIPAIVGSAVFLHATTGWYPLLPVFRRLGLRTSREIARERYALKALRGDFYDMTTAAGEPEQTTQGGDGTLRRPGHVTS
jgi:hypothetical protein